MKEDIEMDVVEGNKAKMICLIGSTRFINEMSIIAWEFEKKGNIVFSPRLLPEGYLESETDLGHGAEIHGVKEIIDRVYLEKVSMSDEIYVCNCNGYIWDSTKNELRHAVSLGKKIRWFEKESSEKYLSEIQNQQPHERKV